MQKIIGRYTKQKLSNPTKINQLIIKAMAIQEEVTMAGGDFMVGVSTIKIDTI